MNQKYIKDLLISYKNNKIQIEDAIESIKSLSFQTLEDVKIDNHRELRKGFPEVIFGEGKNLNQLENIIQYYIDNNKRLLVTRLNEEKWNKIKNKYKSLTYNETAECLFFNKPEKAIYHKHILLIISAGSSDNKIVEETKETAEMMGAKTNIITDVGVAGIHRLFSHKKEIDEASVIIVIAGMDGALASVVGGITSKPMIAVPTSIGYGASFNGLSALLSMLNSCAPGVSVVNIDNGFGAAYAAINIIKLLSSNDNND